MKDIHQNFGIMTHDPNTSIKFKKWLRHQNSTQQQVTKNLGSQAFRYTVIDKLLLSKKIKENNPVLYNIFLSLRVNAW